MFALNNRDIARKRLAAVVAADRISFPPGLIEQVRRSVVAALSRHLDVDQDNADVRLARAGRAVELVASVPILRLNPNRGGSRWNENC